MTFAIKRQTHRQTICAKRVLNSRWFLNKNKFEKSLMLDLLHILGPKYMGCPRGRSKSKGKHSSSKQTGLTV